MIHLEHISKRYVLKTHVVEALHDITLTVNQNEIYGILGKSGAGKSTLLRIVNLLERPSAGSVIVDGVSLTTLSGEALRQVRQKIGMVFQHFNLLTSRSVFDNIAFPLEMAGLSPQAIHQEVSRLLALVGLSEKAHRFPLQLSGGEKQRVGIARALSLNPTVLLCDEATSALDTESTQAILTLLKQINRDLGITILLITHELEVVKQICDRVGVLHHGALIEEAKTVNIFAHPRKLPTKALVQQALHLYVPDRHESGVTIKLTFLGRESDTPLIATLVKQFDVMINLKQALIEKIQETTVGFTICELTGSPEAIQQALDFVRGTSVEVEVLHVV